MPRASRRRRSPPSRRSAKSPNPTCASSKRPRARSADRAHLRRAARASRPDADSTGGGEYLAATKSIVGRETVALLSELLPKILIALTWQKTMRWGSGTGPWVRPVHGVVALFEGKVVPFELFGIRLRWRDRRALDPFAERLSGKGCRGLSGGVGSPGHRRLSGGAQAAASRADDCARCGARWCSGRRLSPARQAGGDLRDPGRHGGLVRCRSLFACRARCWRRRCATIRAR